jgi:HTH-type transcriptional regulator/antitoxin HigA
MEREVLKMPATLAKKPAANRADDAFLALVREFPLRPIRGDETHQKAKATLRGLIGKKGRAVADYKAVLVTLVAQYEREAGHRVATGDVSAADVVRHLLGERNMPVTALATELEISKSTLSEMLGGKRAWSKAVIVKVSNYFALQPGLFLR